MANNVKKILFLDRDGVVNEKPEEHCYVLNFDGFNFNRNIFSVLKKYINQGFEIIIITNQRGIARGLMTQDDFNDITRHMLSVLAHEQIAVLDVLCCPHDKDSCDCRKPKPGLLRKATQKYNIDLANSILVSDSLVDVQMGFDFGVGKNFMVEIDNPTKIIKKMSVEF